MPKYFASLIIIILLLVYASCIEPLEWMEEIVPASTLVVEGRITSEAGPHSIYLRRTQAVISEGPGPGVDNAIVMITDGTNTFRLHGEGSGKYSTDSLVRGEVGKTYELQILVENEMYTASATLHPAEPLEAMEIRPWAGDPDNQEGVQYFEFTYRSNFGAPRPYRYSLDIEIPENVRDYYPDDWQVPQWVERVLGTPDHVLRDTAYYLHPGLEPPALLAYGESIYAGFTYGSLITEKFYSISPEHYEFIRALAAETDWRGLGPFGYIPANIPTNLSNGALGWFSASDVAIVTKRVE
ncbi:MAG: DUF4249 family protein [Saprospiraceae bacterium]|nr:DUF4249 family protein [Saprospiraceae bacterium]